MAIKWKSTSIPADLYEQIKKILPSSTYPNVAQFIAEANRQFLKQFEGSAGAPEKPAEQNPQQRGTREENV